ncbi:GEVED domain-containing protein [Spirosoma soli]|uniref:GEVED domain-containing protein n=1 Tax=Spirosoma soli TaxID=1770529 RepID=A0ABW5MAZ5_9BACT
MKKSLLLVLMGLALIEQVPLLAQRTPPPVCATPDLPDTQRKALSSQAATALRIKQATNAPLTGITYVPIRPHIIRRSNGTGGITLTKLNNVMAMANSYYLLNGTGIQFYFCGTTPDYIDNDVLYNSFTAFNESLVNGRDAFNALNQYYVNTFDSDIGGYAYFPSNSIVSTRSYILNEADEEDLGNRLIPHELGHNFSLYHTFGNGSTGTAELVTRGRGANCTTEGDELCDTPADPFGLPGATVTSINGCDTYSGTVVDAQGNRYTPSVTNIMSYYLPCVHDFTSGQYERIQAGLALRQSHTVYSLNYPPTPVNAPSNLVADIANGSVVLTWQDNANSEFGYFIDRSTSPTSGFLPIGGVGPNETRYVDSKAASYTVYYYRVRPSNATTAGISPVVSIKTPTCRPSYSSSTCTEGDGLASFTLNGVTLSQNSGCSIGGYSSNTAVSMDVTAGQSYTFAGTLLSSFYREGVSIWADLNRNGFFEPDQNERLYITPATLTSQFSGTLTLPASLTAGLLTLRVVVAYNVNPGDPCGIYTYGETEDYTLNVVDAPAASSGADLAISLQTSDRTPALNQPVTYSVTLFNNGPADATGIRWENRLPTGLTFLNGDAGVVGSSTAVGGSTSIALASGQSVTYSYRLRAAQVGTYVNAVQILNSDQPDPDSQPGSGTGDGQDDAASVDIRTRTGTTVVFTSPNPNQTPLPPVASNQPAPNPTKADLSLAINVSNRTPTLNKAITFTIRISNEGGLAASNVVVRDTLRSLAFLSSPTNMSVVNTGPTFVVIEGRVNSLPAGQSAELVFMATANTAGYIRNAAQIWSSSPPDPDSTPGSTSPTANNLNGEDDIGWIDLRVGF